MGGVHLAVDAVRSGYGDVEVLRGISLQVERGEIRCVIGANGSGKSTLLKTIFGLVLANRGRIVFDGSDITNEHPIDRLKAGIALVPQGRCNFPEMTVAENLEMGGYLRRDGKLRADVEALMEKFPVLGKKRRELAGNLSGGEQQILEMASSLLANPELLLLDEPSLGLAPKMVEEVLAAITAINSEGKTVVLVEQNAKQALEISDHAVVLELGRKRTEGPARAMLEDPQIRRQLLGL